MYDPEQVKVILLAFMAGLLLGMAIYQGFKDLLP